MEHVPASYTAEEICPNFLGQLRGCTVTVIGQYAYFVGGRDGKAKTYATFIRSEVLNIVTLQWLKVDEDSGAAPNRLGHIAVSLRSNRIFIYGGKALIGGEALGDAVLATSFISDEHQAALVWRTLPIHITEPGLESSTVVVPRLYWSCGAAGTKPNGEEFVVLFGGIRTIVEGGVEKEQICSQCYLLDIDDFQGTTTLYKPGMGGSGPSGRAHCSGVMLATGKHMVVVGGYDGSQFLNEMWILDLEAWICTLPARSVSGADTEMGGDKAPKTKKPVSSGSAEVTWSRIEASRPMPFPLIAPKAASIPLANGEGVLLVYGRGGIMTAPIPSHLMATGPASLGSLTPAKENTAIKKKKGGDGEWREAEWSEVALAFSWPCAPSNPILAWVPQRTPIDLTIDLLASFESNSNLADSLSELAPATAKGGLDEGDFTCLALDTIGEKNSKVWWLNFASSKSRPLSDPAERHIIKQKDLGIDLGWGREENAVGDVFEGQMKAGRREGEGTIKFGNGDVYTGTFQAGHRHGVGKMRYKNGGLYEGQWESDVRQGNGKMNYTTTDAEDEYEGDWKADKRHGVGVCKYKNGDVFTGDWLEDSQGGHGKCEFGNGGWYEGQWVNGLPHGQGQLENKKGDLFTGSFVRGKQEPEGECIYADGSTYQGQWKAGKRNGTGRCKYGNGDVYKGKWKADKRYGKGILQSASGNRYTGIWGEDQREGDGLYECENGDKYEGQWHLDKRHGTGHLWFKNGGEYVGDWKENVRCGNGEAVFEQGEHPHGLRGRYTGHWDRDLPSGQGSFQFFNGDVYEGQFYAGLMQGRGKMVYALNGSTYTGAWHEGKPNGTGEIRGTREDGEVHYQGKFKNGKRQGQGRAQYENGAVYNGNWVEDYRHGHGLFSLPNGDTYEGQWEQGKRCGLGILTCQGGGGYDGEWYNDQPEVQDHNWQDPNHASTQASLFVEKKTQGGFFKKNSEKYKIGISG